MIFMADHGGVYHYFKAALEKRGIEITVESKISPGKSLSEMVNREIGEAMMNKDVDVVVITSGDLKVMKQFATKLKDSGKRLVVFMTWDEKHPGNRATIPQYTKATRTAVNAIRAFEKDSGATIILSLSCITTLPFVLPTKCHASTICGRKQTLIRTR